MVDYKKYIAVLAILNRSPEKYDFDNESQAEDICELFDKENKERTEDRMTEEEWKRNIINMLG